jgi:CheY-like chemotaxis protein
MTRERGTILVVEDEPIIRMNLVLLLEDQGFAVLEAGNVLEASL